MLKLKEGKEYLFLVEKELIAPDESHHYVLNGPDHKKYLIPLSLYQHYNISVGTSVKCRVDKINCKGEVFLEPENPFYKQGESYSFEVVNHELRTDNTGSDRRIIIISDKTGNRIPVPYNASKLPAIGSRVNLVVERITKGKVLPIKSSRSLSDKLLKSGRKYEFLIERIEKGIDNEDYFIVKDPFGNIHTIAREFYEYYGYKIGAKFKGKIMKYKKSGEKIIEPENPYYMAGSVITLDVITSSENIINNSFTLYLKDAFGFTHCVETATLPEKDSIQCRVVMIRKGKPVLEVL